MPVNKTGNTKKLFFFMRCFMKKLILSFVVAFLLCFSVAASAQAEDAKESSKIGLYIEPKIGATAFTGEYLQRQGHSGSGWDSAMGIGGGLAVGYDFWEKLTIPFRFEAEYMVRSTPHMKADSKSFRAFAPQTAFANLYFDFHNETDFTPYVGGGVGAAFVGPENNFAWNIGGGVSYDINENWKASLGYRFVSFGKMEDNHCKGLLYGHEALLGIRYTF